MQCLNNDVQMSWGLLDEISSHIVEEVVEDKDQGPSKEWRPYVRVRVSSHQRTNSVGQNREIRILSCRGLTLLCAGNCNVDNCFKIGIDLNMKENYLVID